MFGVKSFLMVEELLLFADLTLAISLWKLTQVGPNIKYKIPHKVNNIIQIISPERLKTKQNTYKFYYIFQLAPRCNEYITTNR